MSLRLLPDVERVLVAFLRDQPEVADIVGTRVSTEFGTLKTLPMVRVARIGGAPVKSYPLHLDAPTFQVEAYADTKGAALDLAGTIRAAIAERMVGTHHVRGRTAVITSAAFGAMSWIPDPDLTASTGGPAPRYIIDVQLFAHP